MCLREGRHHTPPLRYALIISLTLVVLVNRTDALHLTGTFQTKDFFLFLAKFGFQKADENNKAGTRGYIYGTIKAKDTNSSRNYNMNLVVVDSKYFLKYYAQRHLNSTLRCSHMFSDIDTMAWDIYCAQHGKEDFLRRVPCPNHKLCLEERGNPANVLEGNQFTYHIVDSNQPRFWYISLVACRRDKTTCLWNYDTSLDFAVDYDIWFVNGDPASKHLNPFEHQFSYELHDVLEIYIVFLVLNALLLGVQIWVFRTKKHALLWMLTAVLVMEVTGMFFNLVNVSVFALDGVGVPALRILGNFVDMCAQCTMMLELLYIAKGWTISDKVLRRKMLLYGVWSLYLVVYIVLFVFTLIAIDPIRDLDEWQTAPGYCILVFRMILMLYFLYELQDTFVKEENSTKRHFYTRFGAGFLVWFIYLPIAALVSPRIAALWRLKTLLSIQSGADFVFLAILVHLFWPGGGTEYFDIPRRSRNNNNSNAISLRTALISEGEESSEDELYQRQASIRLKSMTKADGYGLTNGHTPPLVQSITTDENSC